jgi:hypothetical protein
MRDAKDLHADITKLLLALQELAQQRQQARDEIVTVELSGGSFKSD